MTEHEAIHHQKTYLSDFNLGRRAGADRTFFLNYVFIFLFLFPSWSLISSAFDTTSPINRNSTTGGGKIVDSLPFLCSVWKCVTHVTSQQTSGWTLRCSHNAIDCLFVFFFFASCLEFFSLLFFRWHQQRLCLFAVYTFFDVYYKPSQRNLWKTAATFRLFLSLSQYFRFFVGARSRDDCFLYTCV